MTRSEKPNVTIPGITGPEESSVTDTEADEMEEHLRAWVARVFTSSKRVVVVSRIDASGHKRKSLGIPQEALTSACG